MIGTRVQRPPGTAEDWTIPQQWQRYSPAEHATWNFLFDRQVCTLKGRVTPEFLDGLAALRMDEHGIPDFERLSDRLMKLTGWQVVAVPGLIPDELFFDHLANRRFVAGNFIRAPDQLDYLQEPDIFHDVFGHVPLLAHPAFADYMQAYGEGGLRAARLGAIERLSRLYWYTVEFGLVRRNDGLAIYGAGIASSFGEALYSLESRTPRRVAFDLEHVMRTEYRIDAFQRCYFIIKSFDDLLRQTLNTDFGPLYSALGEKSDLTLG